MDRDIAKLEKKLAEITAENIATREKLAALEKSNQGHWRAMLILLGLFVFYTVIGLLSGKTFSGRWLAVHDRQDHIRAWWDDTGLELHDADGVVRAKLGLFPDGAPYLQFFDQRHRLRSQLFLHDDNGYLMLWDKNDKGVRVPPSAKPLP